MMTKAIYFRQAREVSKDESAGGKLEYPDIGTVYWDIGHSANNMNRPGLRLMIEDIEKGEISTVVVRDISQLSRSLSNIIDLYTLFNKYDVELITTAYSTWGQSELESNAI